MSAAIPTTTPSRIDSPSNTPASYARALTSRRAWLRRPEQRSRRRRGDGRGDHAADHAREGFIDRAYEPDGTLRPRTLAGALITDPAAAAAQALSFVRDGGTRATDGTFLELEVDTLCVHGDTPGAPEIVRAVREAFAAAKVKVAPLRV